MHLCVDGGTRPLLLIVTTSQHADDSQLKPVLDAIAVAIHRVGPGHPKSVCHVEKYGTRKPRKLSDCPEREDAKKHRLKRGSRD